MDFIIPENILNIIAKINNIGYKAHIVGGCLRDSLLNKEPTDWDITTNASPDAIKGLFKKTFNTGLKHGTVTVLYDSIAVEVTTWRKDSTYTDHRRPDTVTPTNSLLEDLSRRDFTMNAMAYHPEEGLVDPFGGLEDLERRLIRCVGNPLARFSEDALRILRAIRFSAQLDFEIEAKTFLAIKELSSDIFHISKERIQAELNKILQSNTPSRLSLIWETGLNKIIFPKIENLSSKWNQSIKHFIGSEYQKEILLVLLFYTSCSINPLICAQDYLSTYKYDNKTRRSITSHFKCLDCIKPLTPRNIRKSATEYGSIIINNIYRILDALGCLSTLEHISYKSTLDQLIPSSLALSGTEIKNLGIEGYDIKNMLDALLHCIYEKPSLNNQDTLMNLVRNIKSTKFS